MTPAPRATCRSRLLIAGKEAGNRRWTTTWAIASITRKTTSLPRNVRMGPEEDPGERHQRKGRGHPKALGQARPTRPTRELSEPGSRALREDRGDQKRAVERAPGDVRPVGPMPEAADEEDGEDIPTAA